MRGELVKRGECTHRYEINGTARPMPEYSPKPLADRPASFLYEFGSLGSSTLAGKGVGDGTTAKTRLRWSKGRV